MKLANLDLATLSVSAVVGVAATCLLVSNVTAQNHSIPAFEVDRAWPKVPPKWKLGDPSSFAIDAQDNVWLLHRPRTLKPEQAAMAAPPVIVFDTAGNFIKAWGGAGSGYEWPEREHGIHIDYKGFVWLGGNNCPTNGLPGLKPVADDQLLKFTQDGKFVMQIGHSNQSKGNADTGICTGRRTCGCIRDQRVVRGRRLRQSSRRRLRCGHRRVQADVGRIRQQAGGRRPLRGGHPAELPGSGPRSISASCTPSASPRTGPCMSPIAKTGASRCSPTTASS